MNAAITILILSEAIGDLENIWGRNYPLLLYLSNNTDI